MRIIVVGAGITGLTAAYEFASAGHGVLVLEKEERAGGLAGSFRVGDSWLEKFYHHIFKSDRALIGLIGELGLGGRLVWRATPMGFFHGGRVHRFGTPFDLLRFTPLGLRDRIALGRAILRFQRMTEWKDLDRVTCRDWFTENVSRECYERVWEPLLRLKFGKACDEIPAAWIWGRIHPRARSRSRGGMREQLGYLSGGFQLLVDRLKEAITSRGGEVREGAAVDYIITEEGRVRGVVAGNEELSADAVVCTAAIPSFLEMTPPLPQDYVSRIAAIGYQSVVCLVLELAESVSSVYWLNIADPEITFGGLIEHTNFIDPGAYGGRRVAYLFNYVERSHPYFRMSKEDYFDLHEKSLRRINPAFGREWVRASHMFRARYGTVIYTSGYSERIPPRETPIRGLFMVNTSQIYPYDRNMNNCVSLGRAAAREIACAAAER